MAGSPPHCPPLSDLAPQLEEEETAPSEGRLRGQGCQQGAEMTQAQGPDAARWPAEGLPGGTGRGLWLVSEDVARNQS